MAEPVSALVVGSLWAFSEHKKRRARRRREAEEAAAAEREADAQRRKAEALARRAELDALTDFNEAALRALCAAKGLSGGGGKVVMARRLRAAFGWSQAEVVEQLRRHADDLQRERVLREAEEELEREREREEAAARAAAGGAGASSSSGGGGTGAAGGSVADEDPPSRDLYAALGVGAGASARDIRRAYQRQALRHHPDRHAGSAEAQRRATRRFQGIARAYEVLSDDAARRQYDADPDAFWALAEGNGGDSGGDAAMEAHGRAAALFMRECLASLLQELRQANPLLGMVMGSVLPTMHEVIDGTIEDSLHIWNALSPAQRREIMGLVSSLLD
eukprot:g2243.t1